MTRLRCIDHACGQNANVSTRHHFSAGKLVPTHGHPDVELVKARLNMIVADTPARTKVAGFALNYKQGAICAYCPK